MLDTEGKILRDADFNILVFEIKIKGYFETRVRLWPQNHPLEPSTPNVSFDSGIDCAPQFLFTVKNDHVGVGV